MAAEEYSGIIRCYRAVDVKFHDWTLKFINVTFGVELTSSTATQGLPTVDTPTPLLLILAGYLLCVCVGVAFLRYSRRKRMLREPFSLQLLVVLHNLVCVLFSSYMCYGIIFQSVKLRYSWWGNPYSEDEKEMAFFIYLFYISKWYELLDTIIMLLKRNLRQISLLHVYHHTSITLIWWVIAHHAPGGDAYFSAALNSGVHVIMYFYYLVSSILRNKQDLRKTWLFWGRYLTRIQMIQFIVNMAQAYYCMQTRVAYPTFLCKTLFWYMVSLLILFGNFYMNKYMIKIRRRKFD